jgi:HK97 family phage major capsid protein
VESRGFNCRSRCFASRSQRDAFYAQPEVKEFLGRVRSMLGGNQKPGSKRSVTGAELGIPEQVMEVLRDNADQYSKLLRFVRLRQVRGTARQPIIGEVPEGIWMEMKGALNELTFAVHEVEMDGFKVGGVIIEDNYLLEDVSDIALGEEILYMLGQAVFLAVDKAIPYGKGKAQKMPLGFVTRLAQTQEPADWGEKRRAWKDLHSSNILKLNLLSATGASFFTPLLGALAKAKTRYTNGERVWIMNEATKIDILIKSLGIDSAAAIVAGMNNTMPIIGGDIVELSWMPDNVIIAGYGDLYVLGERAGTQLATSEHAMFIQDQTVIKGTARYDGMPAIAEGFVAIGINGATPAANAVTFAQDTANA